MRQSKQLHKKHMLRPFFSCIRLKQPWFGWRDMILPKKTKVDVECSATRRRFPDVETVFDLKLNELML